MAYARKFYRRRPRKYIRKGRRTGKRSSTVSQRVKSYVKREIHRNIENKMVTTYGANQPLTNGSATTTTMPLILGMLQGGEASKRIGNQIKVVRGQLKIVFNLLPWNATSNPNPPPVWVKLWVVRDLKNGGQLSSMDGTAWGKLFRTGNASVGFQGTPIDMCFDINKDQFRVLTTKTFRLGVASAYMSNIPISQYAYFDNAPASKQITFNYAKYCKKQLKFDDANSQWAVNENLYLVMQAVPVDGTQNAVNTALVEYHYVNTMEFEDS